MGGVCGLAPPGALVHAAEVFVRVAKKKDTVVAVVGFGSGRSWGQVATLTLVAVGIVVAVVVSIVVVLQVHLSFVIT